MTHREYCAEIVMQKGLYLERLEGHSSTPQHSHNYFEFVYVLHGRALHYTENKKAMIKEGDYFLIDINQSHGYRSLRAWFSSFLREFTIKLPISSLTSTSDTSPLANWYLIFISLSFLLEWTKATKKQKSVYPATHRQVAPKKERDKVRWAQQNL